MTAARPVQPRTSSTKHKPVATSPDTPTVHQLEDADDEPRPVPAILRLPEELRMDIWRLCLIADSPIQWPDNHIDAGLTPSLLRVCRLVNREATPILYERNTLACQHPSDCNMFGWAHAVESARSILSLALHIRDQDHRLWATYLGSSNIHRSLIHDFPSLKVLNITFRSRYWAAMDGTPQDKFNNWPRDIRLKEMCEILKEATTDEMKVRILSVHRVPAQDIRQLVQTPQLREQISLNRDASEARTGYIKMGKADVALALTPLTMVPA